ncbi:D-alanyl-D-alanine carboxypeptidase family protein [Fusibacter ferrireducens]|uniref:D-alanyl-D-alanine carboxypeptidase n=1 Tax=Fusibacter ferrireducens TaxID=2785058 RepID=A0ABR9ZNT7_9FIRM|nr:D-alanyl-D-alanine carboxypeptidase family protein [Fusibacter ferrireducens]MBF4691651.1 D-alanyl-D-alanine carboxypeptidase [Fusibacter ferrireducens]
MTFRNLFGKKILKHCITLATSVCIFTTNMPVYGTEIINPTDFQNGNDLTHFSQAYMLSDLDGHYNVFSYNVSKPLGIASLTKLMTLSIVLDEINQGHMTLNEMVTISEHALSQDGNGLKLHVGEQMSVDDLLHGMLICSSNDAAVALAERVAGSESAFVKLMNQKSASLGLNSVSFVNASGLTQYDASKNTLPDQNMMNSIELLKLTQYLLTHYPELTEITNLESWTLNSKQIVKHNTNALLETIPEVDGFKTGFTNFAGYCQVTTAHLDFGSVDTKIIDDLTHQFNSFPSEKEIVAIVLGASSKYRKNDITSTLINYAKNQCQLYLLCKDTVPMYVKDFDLPPDCGIFPTDTISLTYPKSGHIEYTIMLDPFWKKSPKFIPSMPVGKIIFYDKDQYLLSVDLILKELSQY